MKTPKFILKSWPLFEVYYYCDQHKSGYYVGMYRTLMKFNRTKGSTYVNKYQNNMRLKYAFENMPSPREFVATNNTRNNRFHDFFYPLNILYGFTLHLVLHCHAYKV